MGTQPVTDPAMLITRRQEDFVTWVDTSARKRTIMKYNDQVSYTLYSKTISLLIDSWTITTCCSKPHSLVATALTYPASSLYPLAPCIISSSHDSALCSLLTLLVYSIGSASSRRNLVRNSYPAKEACRRRAKCSRNSRRSQFVTYLLVALNFRLYERTKVTY